MSKKSIGYYIWKSKYDNPYVVTYTKDNVRGETKSFSSINDMKKWIYENDIIIESINNNVSGKEIEINL